MSLGLIISAIACTPQVNTSNGFIAVTSSESSPKFNDKQVILDFADQVVIPTYTKFTAKTKELKTAIAQLVSTPNEPNLKAAQDAWILARVQFLRSL
jgi:uncharacterized iron-regulated protein